MLVQESIVKENFRLDVKFTQAVSAISKWGSGVKGLVQAMEPDRP